MNSYYIKGRLDLKEIAQAKKDLKRCDLPEMELTILKRIIDDDLWVSELAKAYGLPRQNIHLKFQKALVRVWRTLGPREWIVHLSNNKIIDWNIMFSRSLTSK